METKVIVERVPRPCYVVRARRNGTEEKKKAFFHEWSQEALPVGPSMGRGGRPAGQVSGAVAIVELEDGYVVKMHPEQVKFIDTAERMAEVSWPEQEKRCSNCRHQFDEPGAGPCLDCEDLDQWEGQK